MKTFADIGYTCEFGPHKSPSCKLFSADHYGGVLVEITHDELDLFMMGQIMANCFVSFSAPSHHSSPAENRGTQCNTVLPPRVLCVSANLSVSAHHGDQAL